MGERKLQARQKLKLVVGHQKEVTRQKEQKRLEKQWALTGQPPPGTIPKGSPKLAKAEEKKKKRETEAKAVDEGPAKKKSKKLDKDSSKKPKKTKTTDEQSGAEEELEEDLT